MVASKTAVETGVVRAKNARQKRKLLNEAPKVFENAKKTLFIKGGNVSDTITSVFTDLHRLKVSNCKLESATCLRKRSGQETDFQLMIWSGF